MPWNFHSKQDDVAATGQFSGNRRILRLLSAFARPWRGLFLLAIAALIAETLLDILRPYLVKLAVDSILTVGAAELSRIALWYAASVAAGAVIDFAGTYLLQYIGQSIVHAVRQRVFNNLMASDYARLSVEPVGSLVSRVTSDTEALKDLYTDVMAAFASDLLLLTGIMTAMLLIDWRLALVSFTVLPAMGLIAVMYQRFARRAYRAIRAKTAQLNAAIQETLHGISIIRAFDRLELSAREYEFVNREYLAAGMAEIRVFALFRPMVDAMYTAAILILLGYGGLRAEYGGVETGILVAFLSYIEKFFWPLKDMAEKYSLLQSATAAAERLGELLCERPERSDSLLSGHFAGEIRFQDVWFQYPGSAEWVLRGLSFTAAAGQFTGVAGSSGAGKTTLVYLLLRLYEPQRGIIFLDGTDIRNLPIVQLRNRLAAVFQEPHIFQGSLLDNISMHHEMPDLQEAAMASMATHLEMTADRRREGLSYQVGYQGALLSSGERQLLSIARAIYRRPDVLILDEATANIDSETEALIQDSLFNAVQGRTALVIAHRLSTLRKADKIVIVENGRVVEEGNHLELLARGGVYWRLQQHNWTREE